VETRGADELHAVFFKGKPHTCYLPAARGRKSGSGRDDKGRVVAYLKAAIGMCGFQVREQSDFPLVVQMRMAALSADLAFVISTYCRGSSNSRFLWCSNVTTTLADCSVSHCSLLIGKLKIHNP